MDQKHLFFFHLLLGDEDLAIELFYIRIPSLAPLFVFRPIFARRPPKTSHVRMLQRVFLGVLFLAKLAMLRKNGQKLQSWTSSVQSGIVKTLLLSCLFPSLLLWMVASPPTWQNWKTKTPWLAQQAILSRCVLVGACWGTHWGLDGNTL
jgi:hypothetical protein